MEGAGGEVLKPEDKDERQWYLLALHRAEQLEAAIRDRRQFVETQLRLADEAIRAGRPNQAIAIRSKLVEQYAGYTDLADLFPGRPAQPGAGPRRRRRPDRPRPRPAQGAASGESAAGLGAGKARDSPPDPSPPAGIDAEPPPPATEPKPESKAPGDDGEPKTKKPTAAITGSSPEVYQQFDSEFRS